jgi:FtsP/CotA-like multicopper oxidase with cupredoxin domain
MRTVFGANKRLITICTSVLALSIIAFVTPRISGPALATSDDSAYTVPIAEDTNPDPGIFETTLVAQPAGVDINTDDGDISVLTFNGTIPGPEFRLKVGDTVIVHFRNEIAHPTGVHWHGIELHNAHDGTPLTQNMVEPGDTYLYKFKVTRPGIYWYHPHHHSSTNQVFKGMYGSIIVTDPDEESLQGTVLPSAADTRTMVLSDLTVCKAVGDNDDDTYPDTMPHVSGTLDPQDGPFPDGLCELAPIDEDGNSRGPYAAGDVPNIQKPGPPGLGGRVNEGQTVLTNGINVGHRDGSPLAPGPLAAGANMLDVTAGQGLRFQMINAATIRFFRLMLTDAAGTKVPLIRVGGQGGLLDEARKEGSVQPVPAGTFDFKYTDGEILMDPGDRQDVVITIPASATVGQVLTLWTQDFPRTGQGSPGWADIPTVPVAHFNVVATGGSYSLNPGDDLRASIGAPVEVLGAATANLLDPAGFSPVKPGVTGPDIEDIKLQSTGSVLHVDGHRGSHDFPGDYAGIPHEPSGRWAAEIGDTLELTTTNQTLSHHPFHLHGFSIQPKELTKSGGPNYTFPYAEYRDNIDVPAGYTLRYRLRLDDRPLADGTTMGGGTGRWVFHCHIFFHAVFGMISEFTVVGDDGNERPYIDADDTVIEGAASDTLTMTGTYSDPDLDSPIALSASVGTITDDGDGVHWTWEHTGASSGLVYVTATDPDGLASQTVFQLKVNGPPVLTVPGPQSAPFSDPLTFDISATDPDDDPITLGVSGLPASLTLTDHGNGTGTVSGNLTVVPGVYVATFSANDGHNAAVTADVQITVTKETTTLEYIGPTVILNGSNATLSGRLLEDDGPPVIGRTVSFTLGAQACSGPTNASGVASCTVAVSSGLGTSIPITANFAGDAFYLPSSDADTAIVFAFPSKGVFLVGDTSAASGGVVEWWGHSWSNNNVLSGGSAPSAFKGFGLDVALPTTSPPAVCGVPWSTGPGNSPAPPGTVPAYMGVLVSSAASQTGSSISGNTTSIVVVQVDPGYAGNPGKPGKGTVIATFCP